MDATIFLSSSARWAMERKAAALSLGKRLWVHPELQGGTQAACPRTLAVYRSMVVDGQDEPTNGRIML